MGSVDRRLESRRRFSGQFVRSYQESGKVFRETGGLMGISRESQDRQSHNPYLGYRADHGDW